MEESEADTTKAAAEEDHNVDNLDHNLKDGEVDEVSDPTKQKRKPKQTEKWGSLSERPSDELIQKQESWCSEADKCR